MPNITHTHPEPEPSFLTRCQMCGYWPTARNDKGEACFLTNIETGERFLVCDGCRALAHTLGQVQTHA